MSSFTWTPAAVRIFACIKGKGQDGLAQRNFTKRGDVNALILLIRVGYVDKVFKPIDGVDKSFLFITDKGSASFEHHMQQVENEPSM